MYGMFLGSYPNCFVGVDVFAQRRDSLIAIHHGRPRRRDAHFAVMDRKGDAITWSELEHTTNLGGQSHLTLGTDASYDAHRFFTCFRM
jgi:hypothetical protein